MSLVARIEVRVGAAGLAIDSVAVEGLAAYYRLLAKWNARINLTAFDLTQDGTDEAIDRLLVEPVAAAALLAGVHGHLVDVGSGGGSPAVPLKLMRPDLSLTMVEMRSRKAVFLRQVVRELGLPRTDVQDITLSELASRMAAVAEIVTVRAVRLDAPLLADIARILRPNGQLHLFTTEDELAADASTMTGWTAVGRHVLVAGRGAWSSVWRPATPSSLSNTRNSIESDS